MALPPVEFDYKDLSDPARLKLLVDSVVKSENNRTWQAPSPEAAYAFLLAMIDAPGAAGPGHKAARGRAIYRGQASVEWELCPSLLRKRKAEIAQCEAEAGLFAAVANAEFESIVSTDTMTKWPPLNTASGLAAAQHHGLPTMLLDWSALPSVAVDFATREHHGAEATVWWVYWSDLAELYAEIVVPPPFLRRLYAQRGLFIRLETTEAQRSLEAVARRVNFPFNGHLPARAGYCDLSSSYPVSLLDTEPFYIELANWVRSDDAQEWFSKQDPGGNLLRYFAYLGRKYGPDATSDLSLAAQLENSHALVTAFNVDGRLTAIVKLVAAMGSRRDPNGDVYFDADVARVIERATPGLITWVSEVIRADKSVLTRYSPWMDS